MDMVGSVDGAKIGQGGVSGGHFIPLFPQRARRTVAKGARLACGSDLPD
jgi:hypothetical protein